MKALASLGVLLLLTIPLSAQEFVTAKDWMPSALDYAQEGFHSDVIITTVMFTRIEQMGVELDPETGKANGWIYVAYSPELDSSVLVLAMDIPVMGHVIDMQAGFGGASTDTGQTNMSVLDVPIDSDDALLILKQQSHIGTLLTENPSAVCNIATLMGFNKPWLGLDSLATWTYAFTTATDTVICSADAFTGEVGECVSTLAAEILPMAQIMMLGQSYPNPVSLSRNASFLIPWSSASRQPATLTVYNMLGHEVYTHEADPGSAITVPASTFGKPGVYFYTLQSGATLLSKKLVVTR